MLLSGVRYHSNLKITVRRSFDQHAHVWSALHCSKRNKCQESSVSNAPVNAQSKFDMLCQLIVSQHQTMEGLQIHVLVCLDCCGSMFKCRHVVWPHHNAVDTANQFDGHKAVEVATCPCCIPHFCSQFGEQVVDIVAVASHTTAAECNCAQQFLVHCNFSGSFYHSHDRNLVITKLQCRGIKRTSY